MTSYVHLETVQLLSEVFFLKYFLSEIKGIYESQTLDIYLRYRVASIYGLIRPEQIKRTKLSRKVLYHFIMLAIINEILTFKNSRIRASNLLLPKLRPTEHTACGPQGAEMTWQVRRAVRA